MEEKIYKIMRGAGALNIVLGVISLVAVSYTHLTLPTKRIV